MKRDGFICFLTNAKMENFSLMDDSAFLGFAVQESIAEKSF